MKFLFEYQGKSCSKFVSFVILCLAIGTKAMNLELPTDEELEQFIPELEEKENIVFPESWGFSKLELLRLLLETFAKFFGEFPVEGYRPLSTFTDAGIEIQNPSTITLLEDERGEPFLNVKVFRDNGKWVFNGYVNVDQYLGYLIGSSVMHLITGTKTDELIPDEKFKESIIETVYYAMEMAMRRMPKWIELMVDSFESQIELIWAKQIYDSRKQEPLLSGTIIADSKKRLF